MKDSKRDRQTNFNIWLDGQDDDEHAEALKILARISEDVKKRAGRASLSDHQVKIKVFIMALKALAKAKHPELLMPRESSDTMINRIANSMYEIQEELQALAAKIDNGVVLQSGDLRGVASRIQDGYGGFEQSIADGFMSFDDEDED